MAGMVISPKEGVVPVGGITEIKVRSPGKKVFCTKLKFTRVLLLEYSKSRNTI